MATRILCWQHRTLDYTYLFQSKDEKTITLKVYDIARNCLRKESLSDPSQVQALLTEPRAKIPDHFRIFFPLEQIPTLFQDIFTELKKALSLLKSQLPSEHICPITQCTIKEAVIDSCGHSFERSAITQHLLTGASQCPVSRKLIGSLTPNKSLQKILDQDRFPTLPIYFATPSICMKPNRDQASVLSQEARIHAQNGDYEKALETYKMAFQFTYNWIDYQPMPELFKTMNLPQKAQLAMLYLAKYQLKAGDQIQALQTLESLLAEDCSEIKRPLQNVLIHLYLSQENLSKAIPLCYTAAQGSSPKQATTLYKTILHYDPTQWECYTSLAALLTKPEEKAHFLLKGACHALEKENPILAEEFCIQAEKECPKFFLDRLVHLELLGSNTSGLMSKLATLALSYEETRNLKEAIKTYKYLQNLSPSPLYEQKIAALKGSVLPPVPVAQAPQTAQSSNLQTTASRVQRVALPILIGGFSPAGLSVNNIEMQTSLHSIGSSSLRRF